MTRTGQLPRSFRAALAGLVALALSVAIAAPVAAQSRAPRPATLRLTVLDPSNAIIVAAEVTVIDAAGQERRALTGENGQAEIPDLPPGRYTVRVTSPGFEIVELTDLELKSGVTRRIVTLPIAAVLEDVTVARDPRESATDPRGDAFSTVLGQDEIDALPDDPDEMQSVLEQMAGPGATLRVNGFRGGSLPPKSQIQEIRFRRNIFAAENHEAGFIFVDIRTRPGTQNWRSSTNIGFRDESLNARHAFAPEKIAEQQRRVGFSADGPLLRNRTSVGLSLEAFSSYDTQTILAELPGSGRFTDAIRRPTDRLELTARLEHALSKTHALRSEVQISGSDIENLGVGEFDLIDRAYGRSNRGTLVRLSESGPLSRSLFNEVRVQFGWRSLESEPRTTETTIRVLDAFTTGGAGVQGGRDTREFEIADNLDFTKGAHAMRFGVLLEGATYDSTEARNLNGTFTFASAEDFEAGRPLTYTQVVGDPRVSFSQYQFGWYAQDDWRISKNFSLSYGVRHEMQSHVDSLANFAPRVSANWSPFRSGRTVMRAGAGVFFDWFEAQTYEQTLQVDGERQQELVITAPGYPDPFAGGSAIVLPAGIIEVAPDLEMPTIRQASIGVEHAFTDRLRLNVVYMHRDGENLLRGRNVNAPGPDGVRPNPALGNVTQIQSVGELEQRSLHVNVNFGLPSRRLFLAANYSIGRWREDGAGPLSLPADPLNPVEWGPAANDIRHRAMGFFSANVWKGLRLGANFRAQSGMPYTITTGRDDNGDGIVNDRPAGVGRNTERGDGHFDLGMRASWVFGFGPPREPGGPGGPGGPPIVVRRGRDGGGGPPMGPLMGDRRFNLEIYVQASNVLNTVNYVSYSGVLTSPFFGQPTSALAPRRIEVGLRLGL